MCWKLIDSYEYSEKEIRCLNPLSIAYIGDCIYELYIRNYMVKKYGTINSYKIHFEVVKYVNAKAQKEAYFKIREFLLDEETIYFKKGRNTKVKTIPKNALLSDYKIATGFETVIGYLYITKKFERLDFMMNQILN